MIYILTLNDSLIFGSHSFYETEREINSICQKISEDDSPISFDEKIKLLESNGYKYYVTMFQL